MWNAGLDEEQAGVKIVGINIHNLRYTDDTNLMAQSEDDLKSILMKVKEDSEKAGFKTQLSENEDHGIRSHHLKANRWGNNGNSERLYFFLLDSKITANGDCNHEIQRHLLFGKQVMTNLDSIVKSRDIALPTKVHLVKPMVFLVVIYGCESRTVKKAERQRIDAFELWCWRRLLRVPWTARRSNQSILKEISPGCSLKGLMLKLKLQYFGHLMRRTDSLENTLMLGKIEGRRKRGWHEMVGWHYRLKGHEFE